MCQNQLLALSLPSNNNPPFTYSTATLNYRYQAFNLLKSKTVNLDLTNVVSLVC